MNQKFISLRSLLASIFAAVLAFSTTTAHAQIPQDGLVAHYRFQGDARSSTGIFDGTLVDGAEISSTNGINGPFLLCDGDDDYVNISEGMPILADFDSGWSASAWFRADAVPGAAPGDDRFIVFETSGDFSISLGLRERNGNQTNVQFFTNSSDGAPNLVHPLDDADVNGKWNHATLTFENTGTTRTLRAYVNGELVVTENVPGPVNQANDGFHIGAFRDAGQAGADDRFFKGGIDEVAIWERTLTAAEIEILAIPPITVTTVADDGLGSLRQAIADQSNGGLIIFDPALDGETITLDGNQLTVPSTADGLTIDASNLPNGLTIDANQQSRIMEIQPGATAALQGLTLTGGSTPLDNGGAILNDDATLSLSACTLSGNFAEFGGGIFSNGADGGSAMLSLSACTLSGNSANTGGGIFSTGFSGTGFLESRTTLSLNACTLSGNSADLEGGGIYSESGGSDENESSATLSLSNSILAGNTASTGPDLREFTEDAGTSTTTATGSNLISSLAGQTSLTEDDVTLLTTPLALAPLGDYGGPTQTMHPLADSPAILTGNDVTRTDQRGFTLTGPPTIGAVKLGPVAPVSSESTLRNALTDFGGIEGQVIRFEEGTAPITLTGDQFIVPGTANGLFIEASELPNGLTIDANGTDASPRRFIEIQPGAIAALHGLTLTGGVAPVTPSANNSKVGGAIFTNNATLSLSACTLSGNSAELFGGAIYNDGNDGSATLSLSACTLSDNSASNNGGGIFSGGDNGSATLSLNTCTLSGNSAENQGGGIFSSGFNSIESFGSRATLSLNACTLSGNSADIEGGGICSESGGSDRDESSATLSLSNSILAGNTASIGPDLRDITDLPGISIITATGNNLISSLAGQTSLTEDDVTLLTTPLALAPLGHYGGPTQTRPPLPGSPAIDTAGTTNPGGTDQRGFPRFFNGMLDIGAVEFQGNQAELDLAFEEDIDGDGTSVGVELAIGTDPLVSDPGDARNLRLTSFTPAGEPTFTFGFDIAQQDNIILRLVRSTDLVDFSEVIMSNETENFLDPEMDLLQLDDTAPPAGGKAFYRLEAERRPIQQP